MNAIIDFFSSIIEILVSVVQLLVTTISSILWLVSNLPQLLSGVTAGFAFAPNFIAPFLMASLAILIVMMLLRLL